jgi:hypothetical protein
LGFDAPRGAPYLSDVGIGTRIVGAILLGAASFAGLSLLDPELSFSLVSAVSLAAAAIGFAFGAKAWQVVVELL